MFHTRSQDCVTDLSLSYDSRKNVTSLMIFPSRLFSAEPLPHLCEGLTFTLPVSKSYSYFLVLFGSETDWRVRNLGFETLDVLCSSQPLKVSCETVIKVHIYLEYKVSAFSNQNLRPFWFWQSYSALPTSNLYSWNLSSRGKTTKQQSQVDTEGTPCLGTNWRAADTAQSNNPISAKTPYSVVVCHLSFQMYYSIYLPNRERCDTSN